MIKPVTLSEQVMFATVRIETTTATAGGTGTGFYFNVKIDNDRILPLIVTNKHVVAGAVTGRFLVHDADVDPQGNTVGPSGSSSSVQMTQFEQHWTHHPSKDVDLCAMPFGPIAHQLKGAGKTPFHIPMDEGLVPDAKKLDGLSALEEVVMVGYPNGLWDKTNNLPLFRRGITATHPAIDFAGKSEGVIDAACFPGSSGSPVLILNEGSYSDAKNGAALVAGNRAMLLGVLFAGPQMTVQGQIVVQNIPTGAQPLAVTPVMIHLGYYVKAREILTLGQHMIAALKKQGKL
jgi:hypothetical protein